MSEPTNEQSNQKNERKKRKTSSLSRFGYLDNLSLVGTAAEESGGYFPDILDMMEEIPILNLVSSLFDLLIDLMND